MGKQCDADSISPTTRAPPTLVDWAARTFAFEVCGFCHLRAADLKSGGARPYSENHLREFPMEGSTTPIAPPIPVPANPVFYRFCRGVIRLWFALTFRKIRVLHEDRLLGADPALLVVSHPESFLDALILVAGFERTVRCLIPARLVRGLLQPLLARGLGMISFLPENRQSALETCSVLLAEKAALVTFVEPSPADSAGESGLTTVAASIAVEAEGRHAGSFGLRLFPVHLFLPVGHTHTREVLIDIDQPELAQDYVSRAGGDRHVQEQELARKLESKCQENSFRLQPPALAEFLDDLEQALRDNLQEELRSHPERRQKLEGFELSRFVVQWAEQVNYLHPGLLVSLRESLGAWREACRRAALHRFEVEGAGAWLGGALGRGVVVLETVAGLAVACYGLVNHLVAIAILYWAGLFKKRSDRDKTTEWLWRGLVVLGSYIMEVLLVAHAWGRRGAGYYLPTLPLSGLYLWRYAWLLRHQARIAFLSLNLSAEAASTARLRKIFLQEVGQALNHHAEMLGLPH